MQTEKIHIGSLEYLKIDLLQINQKGHAFYIAKINAADFLKIYTVRPAQYDLEKHTALANSFEVDDKYYEHLITEDKDNMKEKDFQRDPSNERINKIEKFLLDEEYAFFPNTIIANCDIINDWDDFNITEDSELKDFANAEAKPPFVSFLQKQNDDYKLFVPNMANAILVIDGQHRLVGLQKMSKDFLVNYDLLITFIIGYDRSIIAKQFYTINYEQKPVNKSLLYQLTGEFTREINELSFMHNVVKLLNELDKSPFQGRIKMLGKAPAGLSSEEKIKFSISQAFLIDSMIRFVSGKAIGALYSPILLHYFINQEEHIHIVRIIARYFTAVEEIHADWNHPEESIISKGMGVAALLKTLNLIFPIIFKKQMEENWSNIENISVAVFKNVLQGLENVDFRSDGPYGKTGSAGNVMKIKNDILSNLTYIGKPTDI